MLSNELYVISNSYSFRHDLRISYFLLFILNTRVNNMPSRSVPRREKVGGMIGKGGTEVVETEVETEAETEVETEVVIEAETEVETEAEIEVEIVVGTVVETGEKEVATTANPTTTAAVAVAVAVAAVTGASRTDPASGTVGGMRSAQYRPRVPWRRARAGRAPREERGAAAPAQPVLDPGKVYY